jgi:hypothetical protein
MVNTFLPYPDFVKSAQSLDYKRLGKQRVEAWQILRALRGETKGWRNHPATNLWRGHEKLLCEYGIAICNEWIARGYNDNMRERFVALHSTYPDCDVPEWLGNGYFHSSHMSNLNRKDPTHYQFNVTDDLPYVWFNNETKELYVRDETKTKKKKVAK